MPSPHPPATASTTALAIAAPPSTDRAWDVVLPDDAALAARWGVSIDAVQLLRDSHVLDLHLDTFIPPRLFGYDLTRRHSPGVLGGRFFGHLDFPRVLEAGLTGGMWSITTNPFRPAGNRWRVFQKNLQRFRDTVALTGGRFELVRSATEYREARRRGAHGIFLSIQGGNALAAAPGGAADIPDRQVVRVTLVHLTNSCYGVTSAPLAFHRAGQGLTSAGRELIEQLDAERVFVDLAHINPEGFWEAVDVHDPSLPLIATHTGVDGVRRHWRNLDDRQVKAIADSGGVVGIIFSQNFLSRRGGPRDHRMVLEHLEHVIAVGGEGAAAIGSDYDGAIVPPNDLRDGASMPRLVQGMLDRGWSEARVRAVLGDNALRTIEALRP